MESPAWRAVKTMKGTFAREARRPRAASMPNASTRLGPKDALHDQPQGPLCAVNKLFAHLRRSRWSRRPRMIALGHSITLRAAMAPPPPVTRKVISLAFLRRAGDPQRSAA